MIKCSEKQGDQVSTFGQVDLKEGQGDSGRAPQVTVGRVKNSHATPLSPTRSGQTSTASHLEECNRPLTGTQGEKEQDKTHGPE